MKTTLSYSFCIINYFQYFNCFPLQAHLTALPAGNLVLRIINNRIFIIVCNRRANNNNTGNSLLYGKLDLPIYVKPRSLRFTFNEDTNTLKIIGSTKSYGISLSSSELSTYDTDSIKSKSRSVLETIKSIDKGFGSVDNIATTSSIPDVTSLKSVDSSPEVDKKVVSSHSSKKIVPHHDVPHHHDEEHIPTEVTLHDITIKAYFENKYKEKNWQFRSRSFTK